MEERLRALEMRVRAEPGDAASIFELVSLHDRLGRRIAGRGLREWLRRLSEPAGLPATLDALEEAGPLALEAAPALIDLVCSEHRERYHARKVLEAIGPGAIPELLRGLSIARAWTRPWIAQVLGRYGPASAAALTTLTTLRDESRDTPHLAIEYVIPIWRIGGSVPDILSVAREALDHPYSVTMERIAPILEEVGPEARPLLPRVLRATRRLSAACGPLMRAALAIAPGDESVRRHLVSLLDDSQPRLRSLAAEALASGGAANVPPLLKALKRALPRRRKPIVQALARLGVDEEVEPSLRAQLASQNKGLALSAAIALEPERGGPEALAILIEALDHNALSADAARALAAWGEQAEAAVPALVERVHKAYGDTAKAARRALWAIAGPRRDVLRACLDIPKSHRLAFDVASGRLGALGAEARPAAPILAALFDDPSPWIRVAAASEHFALIGQPERAMPVYLAALRGDDDTIIDFVIRALRPLAEDGAAATAPLMDLLDPASEARRRLIVETLTRFGDGARPAAEPLAAIASGDDELAALGAFALYRVGGPLSEALAGLQRLADSSARAPRRAACELLSRIGAAAAPALETLRRLGRDESDAAIRYQANRAIDLIEDALAEDRGHGG